MSIKYDFKNPKEFVEFLVGASVLDSIAEEKRKDIIERVAYVINNCRGSNLLVCDILSDSAEKGKLEGYLKKLEIHYQYLGELEIPIQYLGPLRRLIVHKV